ncbi:hypothetical protein [Actinomadura sp. WMMB 499]|uniref:hypothetical protein n=1 Tax=Actinomadura sp. WMMB 499 TaxID=1219491 RepID=UPI001246C4EA|nr:hypothetical protein [Actinomadura sp. WMMB 499]QFG22119.1 hypothetical protein F7P10_14265 [Actinomadura sp. WMMB 499]
MAIVVWGPGYGSAPPPSPRRGRDPFAEAERDTRAMVAAAWWPSAARQQRWHSIGGRMLVLPDGTWWLFGAWARWYRLHPSDGQWYLCPPPRTPAVRMAARPAQQGGGRVPDLPPHVVPAGPDFSFDPPAGLPFVGHGFVTDLTLRVAATVQSAAALAAAEYPHWWTQFTPETPSTVVAAWGVMLWCAPAPAFDSRLDAQMLDLWKPYRATPLPDVDGPRWLTPPTLESLVGLYAERLRAGRVDAAVVVLRTMWAVANALREDVRFQTRADALLAILGTTLANPTVDYDALPYGDQAIAQQWLTRCPPNLVPALRNESSPGDDLRHAFYTLSEVIADLSGDPADPAYIEPRLVAAALLAADLAVVRRDVADSIVPWLDPEVRYTVQAVTDQQGHPLRRLWPDDMRLPEPLRSAAGSGPGAEALLAAMYEVDLAWCRLGGMPARPRGFPVPTAVVAGIIGRNRARATASSPTHTSTPRPAMPPPASALQSQPGLAPGAAPNPPGPAQPDRPFVQPPAERAWESRAEERDDAAPPYTELGFGASAVPPPGGRPGPNENPHVPPPRGARPRPTPDPGRDGRGADRGPRGEGVAASAMPGPGQSGGAGRGPGGAGQAGGDDKGEVGASPPYTELGFQSSGGAMESAQPPPPGSGRPDDGVRWPGAEPGAGAGRGDVRPGAPMQSAQPPPPPGAGRSDGGVRGPGWPGEEPGAGDDKGEVGASPPYTELGFQSSGGALESAQSPPPGSGRSGGGVRWPGAEPGAGAGRGDVRPGAPMQSAQPPPPPGSGRPDGGARWPEEPAAEGAKPGGASGAPPYTELGFQPSGAPMRSAQPPSPATGWPGEDADAAGGAPPPGTGWPGEEPQGAGPVWPGEGDAAAPPYTQLGYGPAGAAQPPPAGRVEQPGGFDPHSTRVEGGPPARPPGTRVLGPGGTDAGGAEPTAPDPGPGTRIMSETMVGNFDFLDDTPSPETPVHEIPPPSDRSERRAMERFGIGYVPGGQDTAVLLDELREQAVELTAPAGAGFEQTRVDGAPSSIRSGTPGVLLVGAPHSGQRRLARLIALTLADGGLGDGTVRAHDAEDVRDAPGERIGELLASPGPMILFERLGAAIADAADPHAVAGAVRRARRDPVNATPVVATCEPRAYKRLLQDHPKLVQAFRVHRLPDFSDVDARMTLLHLLAEERRVTVGAQALEAVRADLERLRGPGDLVNARLVETYLDQACHRNMQRAGASHDRLVLTPDDLAGVAEGIEPALRPPGDIDVHLDRLDGLTGLADVKAAVRELAEDARVAADRARYGVPTPGARNLLFTGPSGTGKTTVAGLLGGIYAALGLLGSGHVVGCRPVHLAGRDEPDVRRRVTGMVEQALGGVLLIQETHLLGRSPGVVRELLREMGERRGRFLVVCSGPAEETERFLAGHPAFRAEFGRTLEFTGMGDRDLMRLFQSYADRDLYLLDEELKVELLARLERLRDDPSFAYARTVRALFEQTVARQAGRLAGADVNAATVSRLTVRDLPESPLEQMMGDFRHG